MIREVLEWSPAEFSIPPGCGIHHVSRQLIRIPAKHLKNLDFPARNLSASSSSSPAIFLIGRRVDQRAAERRPRCGASSGSEWLVSCPSGQPSPRRFEHAGRFTSGVIYSCVCLFPCACDGAGKTARVGVTDWFLCCHRCERESLAGCDQTQEQLRVWLPIGTLPATTSFVEETDAADYYFFVCLRYVLWPLWFSLICEVLSCRRCVLGSWGDSTWPRLQISFQPFLKHLPFPKIFSCLNVLMGIIWE